MNGLDIHELTKIYGSKNSTTQHVCYDITTHVLFFTWQKSLFIAGQIVNSSVLSINESS